MAPCEQLSSDAHTFFHVVCGFPLGKPDAVAERTPVRASRTKILARLAWCEPCADEALAECAETGLLDGGAWFDWGHVVLRSDRPRVCTCRLAGGCPRGCAHSHGGEVKVKSQLIAMKQDLVMGSPSGNPAPQGGTSARLLTKRRKKNPQAQMNGHALAHYLNEQVILKFFGKQPGPVNIEATRQQISRWIHQEGIDPAVVKAMIDHFVSNPNNLQKGTPAWRTFISQRHALMAVVSRISRDAARAANPGDRDSWRFPGQRKTGSMT